MKKIGVHDDFFESGGNSLSAIAMLLEVQKATEHMVVLWKFLQRPTIEALATILRKDGVVLSSPATIQKPFLVEMVQSIEEWVMAPFLYLRRWVSRVRDAE